MTAVQDLTVIVAEKLELEQQMKENNQREKQATETAEKAGWTQAQIKRFMKPPRPKTTTQKSAQKETDTIDTAQKNSDNTLPQ